MTLDMTKSSKHWIQPPGPGGLEEQDSHSPSLSESEGTENISGSHIIIPNNPFQDPDTLSDLLSSGNEHERPKFDNETQKPEDKESQSESEGSSSGRGLKRSGISEEKEDAKKTRVDENDNPPRTDTSVTLTIDATATEHHVSGNTNDDLVDQHENLDQNRYEDPARPLPPIIMIGFGLDPAPQQPPSNTLPCKQFIASNDCTCSRRSVSPLSSEEGDDPLPQGYHLRLQFSAVAENSTMT